MLWYHAGQSTLRGNRASSFLDNILAAGLAPQADGNTYAPAPAAGVPSAAIGVAQVNHALISTHRQSACNRNLSTEMHSQKVSCCFGSQFQAMAE